MPAIRKVYDSKSSTTYDRRGKKPDQIKGELLAIDFLADLIANEGISKYTDREYDWYDVFQAKDRKLLDSAAITSTSLMKFYPQSVEILLRSEIEPQLWIVDRLFDTMRAPAPGDQVKIGAIGALEAYEVAEGGEYKPMHPDIDGGDMVSVQVRKYGGKLGFTLEGKENDKWGLQALWLKKAGAALARMKEKMGMRLVQETGYTFFDNADPTSSIGGSTTGRGIDGAANGTLTINDLFAMYGNMWFHGYTPDVLIMHPFAWMMFAVDPEMRELMNSGTTMYQRPGKYELLPMGGGGNRFDDPHGKLGYIFGGRGLGPGQPDPDNIGRLGAHPYSNDLNPFGATYHTQPKGLPSALTIIVTPLVYARRIADLAGTPASGPPVQAPIGKYLTDIILADSSAIGVHIEKEAATTESWEDIERERYYTKVRERYGFAIYEQGRGISIARNIVADRNFVFDNVNYAQLSPIDRFPTSGSEIVGGRP